MHPDELRLLPIHTGHMSPCPSTAFWLENSSLSMYMPCREEANTGDSLQAYLGAKEGRWERTFCKGRPTKCIRDALPEVVTKSQIRQYQSINVTHKILHAGGRLSQTSFMTCLSGFSVRWSVLSFSLSSELQFSSDLNFLVKNHQFHKPLPISSQE